MQIRNVLYKPMTLIGLASMFSLAARADGPPPPSSVDNSFVVFMIIIIVILALVIGLLANVLLGMAQVSAKAGTEAEKQGEGKPVPLKAGLVLLTAPMVNGISDTAFYFIVSVVLLEVLVILTLLYNLKLLLNVRKAERTVKVAEAAGKPAVPKLTWWDRFNKFRPAEQEQDIDLGHDYDGIRELDNRMPPWWVYGFYCTIVFACIYLWRYHVVHSAPLPGEELQIAMKKAEEQKAEYLKKAANNVDESTVKLLTDPGDLAAGKAVFESTCFACHGKAGEGGVGPNLTDAYWLHGGSIQSIFKTIKYGVPDKGMKSWKDDYSPPQIAQIASYIKSLQGTNPANGKAPQGTLEK